MDKTTGEDISMQADPLRWKALTLVCAAFFMTVLDVSIVNVALPSIGKALDFSREDLQWVITAYAITFGGFLMLGGRSADLLGRRRVFMVGVAVFTAASFLCGLALFVYAVSQAPGHGWTSGWTISRLAVAALLLTAFLVIEARAAHPLMPFHIFRVRTVAGANAAGLLLGAVTFANFFVLTLFV